MGTHLGRRHASKTAISSALNVVGCIVDSSTTRDFPAARSAETQALSQWQNDCMQRALCKSLRNWSPRKRASLVLRAAAPASAACVSAPAEQAPGCDAVVVAAAAPAVAQAARGASRLRALDAADTRHVCPACSNPVRGRCVRQHLGGCAPDALAALLAASSPPGAWPGPAQALARVAAHDEATLATLKALRYGDGLSLAGCSAVLRVSQPRLRALLRRASLAIPLVADATPLDVVFEDEYVLGVCKPPGLRACPVHRFEGHSLLSRAIHHVLPAPPPKVVHRLDEDTSGVTLFAKTAAAAAHASASFRAHAVTKTYTALCLGTPPARVWAVDAPIGRHGTHAPARALSSSPDAKAAFTRFEATSFRAASHGRPAACVITAWPEGGRTHQIRLHAAASGVPIVGDPFYGPSPIDVAAAAQMEWVATDDESGSDGAATDATSPPSPPSSPPLMYRQALHASSLELPHPALCDGSTLVLRAPLLADMEEAAAALGVGQPGCGLSLLSCQGGVRLVWEEGTTKPITYRDDPRARACAAAAAAEAAADEAAAWGEVSA